MDNSPETKVKRLLSNPEKYIQSVLGKAKEENINGLPIPNFAAKMYIPKIEKNPAPYIESLKKLDPQKIQSFVEKNPSLFRDVSNGASKYKQMYVDAYNSAIT